MGVFAYWFFVNEWNSFLHIAGMEASIQLSAIELHKLNTKINF